MQPSEKHYKIVLAGDCQSGKTAFLNRYLGHPASQYYTSTTSVEHRSKLIIEEGHEIHLEIIDTPGSSLYEVLRHSSYKGCQAIIFVSDSCKNNSLQFIQEEIEQMITNDLCSYDSSAVLVGIRTDKTKQIISSQEEAQLMGNLIGHYLKVDLDEIEQIDQVFRHIVQQRLKFDKEDTTVQSMLEKLYQSAQNPHLQKLKSIFESKKSHNGHSKQVKSQMAAPGPSIETEKNQIVVKLILIGESHVGKSSICQNYAQNIFIQQFLPTIGIDFKMVSKNVQEDLYKVQIWDTAGLGKFKTIIKYYYQAPLDIVFFIYDITNLTSFEKIEDHYNSFVQYSQAKERYMCLVGNKTDLQRNVSAQMGMELAQKLKLNFTQISAKNHEELEKLFSNALSHIHNIKKQKHIS